MESPYFELKGITKYFAHVIANKDISFPINRGEVLALLGENGAGKSTIMKILYGLYRADAGEIFMNGKAQQIHSPRDAMNLGITMIQQHFSLVQAHTITENIILGNAKGRINWNLANQEIQQLSEKYGFSIDPTAKIKDIAVGVQQKVEILKALYQDTHLLIMDEPTAVLTPQESDQLMAFVKSFVANGNAVVFITHKLKEVMEVADRIVVMRNGEVFGDLRKSEANERELSRLMIDREIAKTEHDLISDTVCAPTPCLSLSDISICDAGGYPSLNDITFDIHPGEVFGIAGVSGNGQQEICEVICGAAHPTSGKLLLDGEEITALPIQARIERGLGYVPSDRHHDGLVMDMTIAENIFLKMNFSPQWIRHGLIDQTKLRECAEQMIQTFRVKASGPDDRLRGLSGGNQQKVILAREVDIGIKVIVFDQPTRGLDIGAIDNVHQTILRERAAGKAILLISTELSEILSLSDRYTVLYKGMMKGIYTRSSALTTEEIGLLMAGYSLEEERK